MTATATPSKRPAKKQPAFRRPQGAPSAIDDVVAVVDGAPITASERILSAISAGSYVETAAAAAGVDKGTFYDWLKSGARANAKQLEGKRLTANERRFANFSNAVAQAEADAEIRDVELTDQLARGGYVIETKTTTRKGTDTVAETIREETAAPNAAAVMWRLERRHPDRWGRRQAIEVGGIGDAGVGKVASPLGILLGELDAMDRRQREALAETGAVEEALPASTEPSS